MENKELDLLRKLAACDDKELMQRHIEQFRKAYSPVADQQAADIICGVVMTPQVLALVLDRHEVRSLINDTMFYMEHLAQREGVIPKYEYEPRVHLLQKLREFEQKLGQPWGEEDGKRSQKS